MTRIRTSSIRDHHASLGAATTAWDSPQADSLRSYVFSYGVGHWLQAAEPDAARALLTDFPYVFARLREGNSEAVPGLVADATATLAVSDAPGTLTSWVDFLQTRAHLLALGEPAWDSSRILLQLAVEYADDSPVTNGAEAWLATGACDWRWLRRVRRRAREARGPCEQALLCDESEIDVVATWEGHLVTRQEDSTLIVWDLASSRPRWEIEADGFVVWHAEALLHWSANTLSWWKPLWATPRPLWQFEDARVVSLTPGTSGTVLVATSRGELYRLELESADARLLHTFEQVPLDGVVLADGTTVHRAEVLSPDACEELDEEWEDEDGEEGDESPALLVVRPGEDGALATYAVLTGEDPSPIVSVHRLGAESVLVCRSHCSLECWHAPSGTRTAAWICPEGRIDEVRVDGDGIFVSDLEGTIHVLDHALALRHTLSGHTDLVHDLVVHAPTGTLLSCGHDGTLRVWDLDTGACLHTLSSGSPHGLTGARTLPSGDVVTWGFDSFLCLWDVAAGALLHRVFGHTSSVDALTPLPSGLYASTAMFVPEVKLWDFARAGDDAPLENHSDVVAVATGSDDVLVTAGHDTDIRLWRAADGALLQRLTAHEQPVEQLLWLDADTIVSGSWDGTLRRWALRSGIEQQLYSGHTDWVRGLRALSAEQLLSWSDDGDLRLWDTHSGRCLQVLEGHSEPVRGGIALPDGHWVSWSEDGDLRVWEVASGRCLRVLNGDGQDLRGGTLLSTGHVAAWTGPGPDESAIARIWQPDTGDCLAVLACADEEVQTVLWIDGAHWVVLEDDSALRYPAREPFEPLERVSGPELRARHPDVWAAAMAASPRHQALADGTLDTAVSRVDWTRSDGSLVRWIADGEWRLADQHPAGRIALTCWSDTALLQQKGDTSSETARS